MSSVPRAPTARDSLRAAVRDTKALSFVIRDAVRGLAPAAPLATRLAEVDASVARPAPSIADALAYVDAVLAAEDAAPPPASETR